MSFVKNQPCTVISYHPNEDREFLDDTPRPGDLVSLEFENVVGGNKIEALVSEIEIGEAGTYQGKVLGFEPISLVPNPLKHEDFEIGQEVIFSKDQVSCLFHRHVRG